MSGFFPDSAVVNPGQYEPWKKLQRDEALNDYFNGADPKQIGVKYKGARRAFLNSILNKLKSDYKGKATRYKPTRHREDRTDKHWTPNEVLFVKFQQKAKIDVEITHKIIMRPIEEIEKKFPEAYAWAAKKKSTADPEYKKRKAVERVEKKIKVNKIRAGVPVMDLIWAYRYIYFVYNKEKRGAIPDSVYDELVEEECEYGAGALQFEEIKTHQGWPEHIRFLASYLAIKHEREQTK